MMTKVDRTVLTPVLAAFSAEGCNAVLSDAYEVYARWLVMRPSASGAGEKKLSFQSMARVANTLSVPLTVLFSGLEEEQPESKPSALRRGRPTAGRGSGTADQSRLIREVATLERSVRVLKEIAQAVDDRNAPGKRKRFRHPG
jgi:hypothetical protein